MDNRKEEKRGKGPPIVLKALHIKLKMSLTSLTENRLGTQVLQKSNLFLLH